MGAGGKRGIPEGLMPYAWTQQTGADTLLDGDLAGGPRSVLATHSLSRSPPPRFSSPDTAPERRPCLPPDSPCIGRIREGYKSFVPVDAVYALPAPLVEELGLESQVREPRPLPCPPRGEGSA